MSENITRHNVPGVEPREYERNLYFHGKLITVRDMNLEQAYHLGRLNSHTRYVSGEGVLTGLDTTATWDAAAGELTVEVHPGIAYDCYGMPIVVENSVTETETPGDATTVYVSLRGRDCKEELVPSTGAENACADDCEYSHIRESFEVVVSTEEPDPERPVAHDIPEVEFPSKAAVDEDPQEAFRSVSRDYYEKDSHYAHEEPDAPDPLRVEGPPAKPCDDPAVLLAVYGRPDGDSDEWTLSTADLPEEVHPNHKIWSGLVRHASDFDNPHQTHLGLTAIDGGARVDVVDSEEPDSHVDLLGGSDNVTVAVDGRQVTLSVEAAPGGAQEEPEDLDGLRRYVMLRTLTAKVDSYPVVREQFGNSAPGQSASQIVDLVEGNLGPEAFRNGNTYRNLIGRVAEIERRMSGQNATDFGELRTATTASRNRFREAVDDLQRVLADGSTVDIAVAQDWVCEAAERLQFRTIIVPGDRFEDIFVDEDLLDIRDLISEHTDIETTNDILVRDPDEIAGMLENAGVEFEREEIARLRDRIDERLVGETRIDDLVEVDDTVMNALENEGLTTAGSLVGANLEEVSNRTGIGRESLLSLVNNIERFGPGR